MRCVDIEDWHFVINDTKMRHFYASQTSKYDVPKAPRSLNNFSRMLGFELDKPYEIYGEGSEATFVVFGSASSSTGYEIEFQDVNHCLFGIIYPGDRYNFDAESSFLVGIVGYKSIL